MLLVPISVIQYDWLPNARERKFETSTISKGSANHNHSNNSNNIIISNKHNDDNNSNNSNGGRNSNYKTRSNRARKIYIHMTPKRNINHKPRNNRLILILIENNSTMHESDSESDSDILTIFVHGTISPSNSAAIHMERALCVYVLLYDEYAFVSLLHAVTARITWEGGGMTH